MKAKEGSNMSGQESIQSPRNCVGENLRSVRCCNLNHPPRLRTASLLSIMARCTLSNWVVFIWLLMSMTACTTAADVGFLGGRSHKFSLRGSPKVGRIRELQVTSSEAELSPGLSQDQSILLSWKASSMTLNATWVDNTGSGPCGWPWVGCGLWQGENRVTVLNMTSLNLTGPVLAGISKLPALTSLSFAHNSFNGSIPSEVGNCSNLQVLDLSNNMLSGEIPAAIGRLAQLQILDLSWNRLNGSIPPELFTNCSSLTTFNTSSNRLSGGVPKGLGTCKSLRSVDVGNNTFQGAIPPELGQIPALQTLIMSNSGGLDGPIPDSLLSSCQNLQNLDFSWNKLTGGISPKLGNCSNLEMLNIQGNWFSGSIPAAFGQLKKLEALGLGSNNLTGSLPQELSQCSSLYLLDVSNNSLSGLVPTWLSQLPKLQYVTLQTNKLAGRIPVEITTLPMLRYFDLSGNSLEGGVLAEFGRVTSLRFLRLSDNRLNGSIPTELGNLYGLQGLDLSSNSLTGSIPTSFGALQDLLWLQLAGNSLSGEIPEELADCSSLMWVNLAANRLTGSIPPRFSNMGWDADRVFLQNRRDPWIFEGLGECSILSTWAPWQSEEFYRLVEIQRCQSWLPMLIEGDIRLRSNRAGVSKVLSYWQLSRNNLTGPIPDLSNSTVLGFLILSENRLSGPMPYNISHLPLYNLNVSHNFLSDSIPSTLGNLSSTLIALDMSYNNLSGKLPQELADLNGLSLLNISYNEELWGPIPTKYQFTTLGWSPYVGDRNLCFIDSEKLLKNILQNVSDQFPLPGLCIADTPSSAAPITAVESECAHCTHDPSKVMSAVKIAVVSVACTLTVLLLAGTSFWLATKWCRLRAEANKDVVLLADASGKLTYIDKSCLQIPVASFGMPGLEALTYAHLLAATDNFNDDNIIGDGGFGIVYKAKLANGSTVAIKKLTQDGAQGAREFQAEMETLGTIKHKHLVSLLGYCCNNEEKLLVYEYMKNGSLDDMLYESDAKAAELDWPRRLQIALGTARGLAFLHHDCMHLIIHRDMKSSNILLDDDYHARLTDFGMARIMDADCTHVSTAVAGTPGYVPPEYGLTWRATTKGDVYSFGVVMLELISGKRPTGPHFNGLCGSNLVEMADILVREGRPDELCDPMILQTGAPTQISQFLALALRCVDTSPASRPSMLDATQKLQDIAGAVSRRIAD